MIDSSPSLYRSGAGRDGSTTRDAARTGSHQIEASLPSTTTRAPNVSIPHEHTSASALDSAKVNEDPAKASDRASTSQECVEARPSALSRRRATSLVEICSSKSSSSFSWSDETLAILWTNFPERRRAMKSLRVSLPSLSPSLSR